VEIARNASDLLSSATRLLNGARSAFLDRNGGSSHGPADGMYEEALASDAPFSRLWEVVHEELGSGRDRDTVIADLVMTLQVCRAADRETEADAILDVLDSVYGFAPPSSRL
jgi:hypothetical protein